jgi:hypothetical protein
MQRGGVLSAEVARKRALSGEQDELAERWPRKLPAGARWACG